MMSLSCGRRVLQRALQRQVSSFVQQRFASTTQRLRATYAPAQNEPLRGEDARVFNPRNGEALNLSQHAVTLSLDGTAVSTSPLLLRDLCACDHCIDPSTKQKHFSTAEIPAGIKVRSATELPDKVQIQWTDDIPGYDSNHVTELPKAMLHQLFGAGSTDLVQNPIERALWDAAMYKADTVDLNFRDYMADDSVLLKALRQLHTHGLLFVTNVPEDGNSVESLAERIGPLKSTFYGRTWDVRSVPNAINVAYTAQNLGFHMDLMYLQQPPHLQLLHCIRSSAAGGASLFTDSFRAVVDLAEQDEEALDHLTAKKVKFHYNHPGSQYYQQYRSVVEQKPQRVGSSEFSTFGDMRRSLQLGKLDGAPSLKAIDFLGPVSWSPPFQGPFGLSAPADSKDASGQTLAQNLQAWHPAAQLFNNLIHREEMIYERMMKPGECVIFDNRRVLHARRAFEVGDAGKERWLKGAYIDEDPYHSRLKVLRAKLEKDV